MPGTRSASRWSRCSALAAYYRRFGFRLSDEYGIVPPVPQWQPHFQVRVLSAYRPEARGTFAYPEPFDRV